MNLSNAFVCSEWLGDKSETLELAQTTFGADYLSVKVETFWFMMQKRARKGSYRGLKLNCVSTICRLAQYLYECLDRKTKANRLCDGWNWTGS